MNTLKELLGLSTETLEKMLDEIRMDDPIVHFTTQKIANFEIRGLKYKCEFNDTITDNNKKILEFKFYLLNNPKSPKHKDFKTDQQYQVALQKSKVGVTGTGNQFQVLSAVCTSIKKYIDENRPDYITFTADEENRQRLYETILKWAMKYIRGYRRVNKNPVDGSLVGNEEFWLEKYE